jgi:hypothetical protein
MMKLNEDRFQTVRRSTPWTALLALVCVVLMAASAMAAPPEAAKQGKQFDFETDEVTVDVLKPDSATAEVLAAKARESLIRIRLDFINEIVRSAEDI